VPVQQIPTSAAEHCIQLLCHSERIKLDIQFSCESKPLSLLLLNWKKSSIKRETRCLIWNKNIIALTQYYVDLMDCYGDVKKAYEHILKFFENNRKLIPVDNCVMDLDMNEDFMEIYIIEFNGFDEADKCLFDRVKDIPPLLEMSSSPNFIPPFRYMDSKSNSYKEYPHSSQRK